MTAPAVPLSLDALRRRLAEVLGEPRPEAPGLPTGVAALDRLLPGGGLPRGRLTTLVGPAGGGRTTLVRAAAAETLRSGGWVAYVDATRTLAPREWAEVAAGAVAHAVCADRPPRLCVVRPHDAARGAWCADVLLRSGAFALVVLDGAPPLSHATAVRLTRLARDADAALVVLGDPAGDDAAGGDEGAGGAPGRAGAGGRVVSAVRVHVRRGRRRRRWGETRRVLQVTVEKGGSHRAVEVSCAIGLARRLCAHPEVPDRRGVGRGARGRGGGGGRAADAGAGSDAGGASHGTGESDGVA